MLFRPILWLLVSLSAAAATDFSGKVTDSVTGKVTDSTTGRPIAGAIVTVGSTVVRAGGTGDFQIRAEGAIIAARAYGYSRTQIPLDAHSAKSLELKLAPITPHALYLSFWGVGTAAIREPVLRLTANTPINAVVIDVKGDLGYVCYRTAVATATDIGAQKVITVPDIHALLDRLHKQGIYTIARIVTFKDNKLGTARPKLAVHQNGSVFKDHEGLIWCDPFLAEVRSYNVDLAVDAAQAGFDEIQFDYVRFPDAKGVEFSEAATAQSRSKAIADFLATARDRLVPFNVFLAADVFGYICWNQGDTGIGQDINNLGAVLDYICPMLYPSGFMYGIPKYRDPVVHPYEIVRFSLDRAKERTKLDPVRFRPWLQAFADYAFDKRQFGEKEVQAQIKAAQSFGSDGWILWNPRNLYSAESIRPADPHVAASESTHLSALSASSK
jgi:hypothetical protein